MLCVEDMCLGQQSSSSINKMGPPQLLYHFSLFHKNAFSTLKNVPGSLYLTPTFVNIN